MIYVSPKMRYQMVRIVRESPINDILICRDPDSEDGSLFTLLCVKQHRIARNVLLSFDKAGKNADGTTLDHFDHDGALILVFPYKTERPLSDFYMGSTYSLEECEDICINVIITCIQESVPPPLMYLMLRQRQLNIAKDHSIYFSYQVDLKDIDPSRTERDCAVSCAAILIKLLEAKASEKTISYKLLTKKAAKNAYHRFTELYKDVRIAAAPKKKRGILAILRNWYLRNKDNLFKVLLVVSIILAFIVLVSVISQLIFGEVPWVRLFINGFKLIGTERLDVK